MKALTMKGPPTLEMDPRQRERLAAPILASGSVDGSVCADSADVVSAGSAKGTADDCAPAIGAYPPSTQHKMINSAVRRTQISIRVC